MARCATVRTGCYGPRPLHGDARFDRPSRFKSRVPAQPFRMLLFHFASLKTAHAALLAVKALRSNRRRHKSVRRNSCNDTGVERWHPGDIFRVGPSDVNEKCRHFRNLDIVVFRSCSTPLAVLLSSREREQSASPSDFARSRVLRGGCGRVLVRHFDRTRFQVG